VTAEAAAAALQTFADEAPGRSVAARTLAGPPFTFAANADVPRRAASLAKVPLAIAVLASDLDLDASVARAELPAPIGHSVLAAFEVSHRFTWRELVNLLLMTSDNAIEVALRDRVDAPAADTMTANEALDLVVTAAADPVLGHALRHNLRDLRIPLGAADGTPVAHKTGTLMGVANDAGVIEGESMHLAIAFLTDEQPDMVMTSYAIGLATATALYALGGPASRAWSIA
jgi:beta-lactamase class A